MDINVATTSEYLLLRDSFQWLFETAGTKEEPIVLGSGKYQTEVFSYNQYRTENGVKRHYCGARVRVQDQNGRDITKFDMINEDRVFLELIEHQNGKEYLLFRKDLYGYSVMDIESGITANFIPQKSFMPLDGTTIEEETFICCKAKYCKTNDLLVIDGCYWGCPDDFEFYDFGNPMILPFPLIGNAWDLTKRKENDIVIDIDLLDFTDTGNCVFALKKDGMLTRETMEVDILKEFKYERS